MSLMMHTQAMPLRARAFADPTAAAGAPHLAMIKRFAKFVPMVAGFFLLMAAIMAVKYAAFFLRMPH